ncbi:MAG: NADH-quinone oxidoreductase subunit L [Candidatus Dormibacteria bacterium]
MSNTAVTMICGLTLLLPLAGSLLNGLLGPPLGRRFVNIVGPGSIAAAFAIACLALAGTLGAAEEHRSLTVHLWQWMDLGHGSLSAGMDLTLDPLSCVMLVIITGVGSLIHWYSVGYMEHEPEIARFFAYKNFFVFSMILLVLAGDLMILIIGWALVALSSYLLIGFHHERPSAVAAARKAFITQVIGDVALVIAAFMIVTNVRGPGGRDHIFSLSLPVIFDNATSFPHGGALLTGICLLLALAAFAKSAQFPLHTWLPDAMEGPTPVSALIHAATMVTAGVYLIARFHPLFDRSPVAQGVVACVGMGTALMAAIIALSQIDIKRVIAYSTMSQIGLMTFAVGIGAYTAALFHLAVHAIFKALLFLGAGNVIHALHDEQDIRAMGGVGATMRWTERWFLCGSFALAGVPFFAGWFSKEGLLGFGTVNGPGSDSWLLYLLGLLLNVLTGLYAFRLWAIVFRGVPQTARVYAAHEARRVMLAPVAVLGVLSVAAGLFLQWPVSVFGFSAHAFNSFLEPVFTSPVSGRIAGEPGAAVAWLGIITGTAASLLGVGAAMRLWLQRRPEPEVVANQLPRLVTRLSLHRFYVDELYDAVLVQPIRTAARAMRRVVEPVVMDGWVRGTRDLFADLSLAVRSSETGMVRDYATYTMAGAVAFLTAMLVVVLR